MLQACIIQQQDDENLEADKKRAGSLDHGGNLGRHVEKKGEA